MTRCGREIVASLPRYGIAVHSLHPTKLTLQALRFEDLCHDLGAQGARFAIISIRGIYSECAGWEGSLLRPKDFPVVSVLPLALASL
jgi:hypothetical protein